MLLFIITNFSRFGQITHIKIIYKYLYNIFNRVVNCLVRFRFSKMDKIKASNNITSTKRIVFKPDDKQYCFETHGAKEILVMGSAGNGHDHGSSKVKLKNIVDYKWEQKNYPGRLIAVNIDGNHIAYAIKVNNRGTIEGMVRVVNFNYSQRTLIKGMSNEILDIQFAHLDSQIILGCIEETALHIYKIESMPDKMISTVLIKINDPIPGHVPKLDKISWCPYVPENKDDVDEYASQLLVWVRGSQFQCYSVNSIVANHGTGVHNSNSITSDYLEYKEITHIITGATFSPDGTTLAISSEDGYIRFYQVYLHADETKPRCLHQWKPHGGKAISSFFFLDNHSEYSSDNSLWKHAMTASDNNTEFKIWSCETWKCTQTIIFQSPIDKNLNFKAEIDRTSSYLILSDMNNRGLYVLQIVKENDKGAITSGGLSSIAGNNGKIDNSDDDNNDESNLLKPDDKQDGASSFNGIVTSTAYVKSISEFPLSSPILSFGIVDAAVRKYKCGLSDGYLIDELEDYDEENNALYCVVIHMYLVQPKSVQECHVLYQPSLFESADVKSTISNDSADYEAMTDISMASLNTTRSLELIKNTDLNEFHLINSSSSPKSHIVGTGSDITSPIVNLSNSNINLTSSGQKLTSQINLMTPDSFNSSGKKSPEGVSSDVLSTLIMLANATSITTSPDVKKKSFESLHLLNLVNNTVIEEQEQLKVRKSVELQKSLLEHPSPTLPPLDLLASGGSSPSREVQEILSLKDSDCLNEFYSDSENLILDENDGILTNDDLAGITNDLIEDDNLSFDFNEIKDTNIAENLSPFNKVEIDVLVGSRPNTSKGDWPKVPDVPLLTTQHTTIIEKSVTNKQIDSLSLKMEQMFEIMETQSCQIKELSNQLYEFQKQTDDHNKMNAMTKLETNLSKLIEEYLIRYERQHNSKLDNFLAMRDKQNRELRDSLLQSITQMLYTQITERLSAVFAGEIQRHTLPLVAAKLDNIKQHLQLDIAQKLATNDQLIKEYITKICTSKNFIDTFGTSVILGVQNGLQSTYVDSLNKILIPAYEKSTVEMFKQMRETFLEGVGQFTKTFEGYIAQYIPQQERSEEILTIVQEMPEKLMSYNSSELNQMASKITHDFHSEFKNLNEYIIKNVKDNIKSEIENGFASQAANLEDSVLLAVRSQAQTPAPSIYDVQEQIKLLLGRGEINKAFHQALLANDLNLVEFTIDRADYKVVFNPCPLEQSVLLSLIQQISADMKNHTELKQKYLSDAILSLNFRDTITLEHAPKVMRELYQKCQNFLVANPNSSLCSGVKMLIMAVQGMGFKPF